MEEKELTLEEILFMFRKRFKLFLLVVFATVAFTVLYLVLATPIYEASVKVKVEPLSQAGLQDIFSQSIGYTGRSDISTEVELIKSKVNVEKVVEELNLLSSFKEKNPDVTMDRVVSAVSEWINVEPVKDTKIVRISVEHSNPELAAKVANSLADAFNDLLKSLAQREYTAKRVFIESQIPNVEQQLEAAEEELKDFKEKNGIFVLEEEARRILEVLSSYDSQKNELQVQIEETKTRISTLRELLSKVDEEIISSEVISTNPVVSQLKQKLADLKVQLAGLVQQYPETDRRVVSVKQQIAETEELIKKEVEKVVTSQTKVKNPNYVQIYSDLINEEAKLQVLTASLNSVEKLREMYSKRASELPELEKQLLEIQRKLNVLENIYTLLLTKLQEIRISEAGVIGNAQVIDYATVPTVPVKPNKKLTLAVGGVLGVFLGILSVFLMEFMDKSIKSEEELKFIVGDVPVLGRIPHTDIEGSERIVEEQPTSPTSESIKLISTNVDFSSTPQPRSIVITSAGPSEGKTFTAANLAMAYAQNGYRTLLIDLDMRRPRVERVFGLEKQRTLGVVNHVLKDIPLEKLLVNASENLYLLPVGPIPPNPTSILTGKKFVEFLESVKEKFDKIIIDTPPILAAADSLIIAKNTDGIVLVVSASKTQKNFLKIALENIKTSGNRLLGIVINGVSSGTPYYYYYYYYYYTKEGTRVKRKGRKKQSKTT